MTHVTCMTLVEVAAGMVLSDHHGFQGHDQIEWIP
jgi:hypothetical protein